MTSDDLVKRLRLLNEVDANEAAYRIEELEKACKEWSEVSQSNYQRAKAAEAKLADGDFDVVKTADIAEWREKLNKRFGIGDGRMKSLDVVLVEWSMAEPEWFHEFAHTAIAKTKGEQP